MNECKHEWRYLRDGELWKKGYYCFFCQSCLTIRKVNKENMEE